jgi:hypothetical protein
MVSTDTSKELLNAIKEASTDDEIQALMCPEEDVDDDKKVVSQEVLSVYNGETESNYVEFRGNSAYIPSISELTVPQDFVEAIIKAEQDCDEVLLETYLNFWTLVSLNPDSRVRNNIFWFIKRWNIKITKNGLLVTYRNADFKKSGKYGKELIDKITSDRIKIKGQKKSPKRFTYNEWDSNNEMPTLDAKLIKSDSTIDSNNNLDALYVLVTTSETVDTTTFTDHHSHTFNIQIGKVVSMPREKCNANQEESCSQGLHQGGPGWLKQGYYGDTGLVCLVNPANIVAIPMIDQYGKMRCCEYLPIAIAQYDDEGNVIEDIDETGLDFAEQYLVDYSGKVNNEDFDNYTLNFVRNVGIDRTGIARRIFEMAKANE